jgi:hypothetical protein
VGPQGVPSANAIKERSLGVAIFRRLLNYDPVIDSIVRIAANEIRMRLAQWYQEPTHHQRVGPFLNSALNHFYCPGTQAAVRRALPFFGAVQQCIHAELACSTEE